MEIYRGDSFYKRVSVEDYIFKPEDVLRIAILLSTVSDYKLYEQTIEINEEKESVLVEIPASKMRDLTPGSLVLELELTYAGGLVKTEQYELIVKADGIHE